MSGQDNSDGDKKAPHLQVVLGSLGLPARLALRAGLSLKELKHLTELAVFGRLRNRGAKLKEIASTLGVSAPKASLLSRDFKDHFAAPEIEFGIKRRVLRLLWAQALTKQRLVNALSDIAQAHEIETALESLLTEGRVVQKAGRTTRYAVGPSSHRMVEDEWIARLDALDNAMEAQAETVEARFFDNDERAFARTIQLEVLPQDLPLLERHYKESFFALLSTLNERAEDHQDSITVHISLAWAPERRRPNQTEDGEDHHDDD